MTIGVVPKHPEPAFDESDLRRFLSKISKTESCWIWKGTIHRGYGVFKAKKLMYKAHRISLALAGISYDMNLVVNHICRIRCCVNPKHLEQITSIENVKKGANSLKTHCKNGHQFSGDNLRFDKGKTPQRVCCACQKIYKQNYIQRKSKNVI